MNSPFVIKSCLLWVGFYGISNIIGYLMPNQLYTYILIIYGWVGFYGISTIVSHLMPNHLKTYVLNIYIYIYIYIYNLLTCFLDNMGIRYIYNL